MSVSCKEVRNPEYPSQYVECVYGLGKWLYPHHLKGDYKILSAFWRYQPRCRKQPVLVQQQVMFKFNQTFFNLYQPQGKTIGDLKTASVLAFERNLDIS